MRIIIVAAVALAGYIVWRISLMRLKEGASLENVSWRMFYAALVWDGIAREYGEDGVITSGVDGRHSAQSKHYTGEALDFRTWRIPAEEAAAKARKRLGPDYDVVVEATHIHIEYDPKGIA